MGILSTFVESLIRGYNSLVAGLNFEYASLLNVFIFSLLIALYAVFTWKFYRSLSKKDLIELNLSQYNRSEHPVASKFFASILYLLEYIIILPFLIFFWFAILAIIILVLSEDLLASQILIISAAIVAAIRMLAYYEEGLSQDLAKVFPLTILTIVIISPAFFSLERILTNITDISEFTGNIVLFLVLIIGVELILRIIDTVLNLFRDSSESKKN